ncbi:MAG: methyltransferase domain-containing protein [Candidatus Paracaedibacteraceae bacterium]|nr:methyltransferase domain-containing protein [Candidatus Paracaedibacteraceae bacterium]
MFNNFIKPALRPVWRKIYQGYEATRTSYYTFEVPIDKLLRGGENGIRAARYAELTDNFMRPSTPITEGPHVKLLRLYEEIGDKVFEDKVFTATDYYKNALECLTLTGSYFYDHPEKIIQLARRFINQYKGKDLSLPSQPGQSNSGQPIWVRPIKFSSYYEVIDGNHRIARTIMGGEKTIKAIIYEKEPVFTPLQELLLDCLWINKQKWLYQPIEAPELKDQWTLVRQSIDRLEMMKNFLTKIDYNISKKSYLDIGSSYGWFVKNFTEMGFNAFGIDRDPFSIKIGMNVYQLKPQQITNSDIILGLNHMIDQNKIFDVVSCLSVLHHFVLNKSSTTAEDFIKKIDKLTKDILFIDTGEEHEEAFEGSLKGWNPQYIQEWILKNTSFKKVIALGVDQDKKPPFNQYYNRTLFACTR